MELSKIKFMEEVNVLRGRETRRWRRRTEGEKRR